jgi:hypothetical protein
MAGSGLGLRPQTHPAIDISAPKFCCGPPASSRKKSALGRNLRAASVFALQTMRGEFASARVRLEGQAMNVLESILAKERFVLPKQSWIIPGLTLGASLVALALALALS